MVHSRSSGCSPRHLLSPPSAEKGRDGGPLSQVQNEVHGISVQEGRRCFSRFPLSFMQEAMGKARLIQPDNRVGFFFESENNLPLSKIWVR
jgi:hypothetical protein